MSGVIPSHAFNEQLKKVVRESIRRDRGPAPRQGRWHKKGKSQSTAIVEGFLTSNLGSGSGDSATMAVRAWNADTDSWSATGEVVLIVQRGGFPANSGAYCVAFKVFEPQYVGFETYRPIVLGCN